MWSEIFFQNLKDSFSHLISTRYTNKDIEYTLFQELKSEEYKPFVTDFNKQGDLDYP